MFGNLNGQEIEEVVKKQYIGHLSCCADNQPYVVPVSYAYDGQFIYIHSLEGMKLKIMRQNPNVCFVVDDTRNMSEWRSVVMWGVFEELGEGIEREQALRTLESRKLPMLTSETMRLTSQWPFSSDAKEIGGVTFRIRIREKTGRFEKSADRYFFAT